MAKNDGIHFFSQSQVVFSQRDKVWDPDDPNGEE